MKIGLSDSSVEGLNAVFLFNGGSRAPMNPAAQSHRRSRTSDCPVGLDVCSAWSRAGQRGGARAQQIQMGEDELDLRRLRDRSDGIHNTPKAACHEVSRWAKAVLVAVGCIAIRREWQVQSDADPTPRTRPRPIAVLLYPGLSSRRADARLTSDMSGGRWRSRLNVRSWRGSATPEPPYGRPTQIECRWHVHGAPPCEAGT